MTFLGIANYPAYALAVLVFLMIPGPGTFAVLTSSARGGIRGGYLCLAGLALGDWVLMISAMLGLAALLQANPTLFKIIQYLGAAYLVWVGIQLIRAKEGGADPLPEAMKPGPGKYFRQSFLITLINPKAIVFYMSFFPLFMNPEHHKGMITFLALGVTVTVLTLLYCSLLIFSGNAIAKKMASNKVAGKIAMRLAGIGMVGFGVKMATN